MARNTKNKSNVHITNLGAYTSPEVKEVTNSEYVEYGKDNLYFDFLIKRYIGSTTNNAIINGIVKMIYGKGLSATNGSKKPEDYAQALSLFKKPDLRKFITDRKMLGMAAFQVTYEKGKVKKVSHFPMDTLRPEKMNEKGEIEAWHYFPNWKEKRQGDETERINAFGFGNNKGNEIFVLQPYTAGFNYFSPVDYIGAVPYALLEEEISDYLINDVKNSFSGTRILNFNNGIPDEEQRHKITQDVNKKTTGSNGLRTIVSFNNNAESKTTIDDVPLNDAPAHYQYLADECRNKLIVGHRVTSPMLIGVRETGGGLGNNADEIKIANLLFDNVVINTYQEEIIDVIDEILAVNDISLNLYFKTIEPLEFIEVDGMNKDTQEEETGVKMSKENEGFDDDKMLEILNGENIDLEEWELVDKREFDEENESIEDWASKYIKEKLSVIEKLAGFIKSAPIKESKLDKSFYKVRYTYQEKYPTTENSRHFCKNMMQRTSKGVVYRKEDIDQASFSGINKEFGHNKQNYSLFRFKGGVNCGHFFQEELYRMKSKTEKQISKGKKANDIPNTYKPKGKQYDDAKKAPKDMKDNGHHPNYNK